MLVSVLSHLISRLLVGPSSSSVNSVSPLTHLVLSIDFTQLLQVIPPLRHPGHLSVKCSSSGRRTSGTHYYRYYVTSPNTCRGGIQRSCRAIRCQPSELSPCARAGPTSSATALTAEQVSRVVNRPRRIASACRRLSTSAALGGRGKEFQTWRRPRMLQEPKRRKRELDSVKRGTSYSPSSLP